METIVTESSVIDIPAVEPVAEILTEPVTEPEKVSKRRGLRGVKSLRVKELIEAIGLDNKPALVKAIMDEFSTTKANANAFIFNVRAKM